ncbi:phospholipase D family protein [Rhodoferax saidenbachensis]|uniref:Phosphatidylserine/phosphatidylglycerophosphate/ cardiolipin synthase-like enzyme n=1 Tax=Rhodoferax saidenbachensis TaxID=1484693 RepID=A0ABU1ZNT1_9BURK|nr:phospholipase D family protein [Rhodoferax saidenbachensis]MDR7307192.1 phosphatidylserine/phosphatidylglycerophosphate/cardiolipin synthase-like enzyme [Rhodoferax saidenbachensis]
MVWRRTLFAKRFATVVCTMPSLRLPPSLAAERQRGVGAGVWRWLAGALLCAVLTGCASLPSAVDRPVSSALANPAETRLGAAVAARAQQAGTRNDSGFALVGDAELAFSSRMALIQAAQKTLDLQYYAIFADETTERMFDALRDAAARGVRIRLLLDDFNTSGKNAQVLRLAFEPNIALRLFNPLPGGRGSMVGRVLSNLKDTARMQRRMHNKMLVADNAVAITGGRNLGETYFGQGQDSNFVDLDVLAAGRVVRELSHSFDLYWNNPLAYPVESLMTAKEIDALKPPPVQDAVMAPAALPATGTPPETTDLRLLTWTWAPSALLVDKPSKIAGDADATEAAQDTTVDGLLQLMAQARRSLLIVSPYFVPGERMLKAFADLRRRDVQIRVLTNSLASNDAPAAHVGYARYRRALLGLGIELYEMRAEQRGTFRSFGASALGSGNAGSRASLHSKLVVMDDALLVVGSMNLDLRSQLQNSEVAIAIRNRAISAEATRLVEPTLARDAYRVELRDQQLWWRAPPGAVFPDASAEPDASLGLRFITTLIAPFAPDEML